MAAEFQITRGIDHSGRGCFRVIGNGAHFTNRCDDAVIAAQFDEFEDDVKLHVRYAARGWNRYGQPEGEELDRSGTAIDIEHHSRMFGNLILGVCSIVEHCLFAQSVRLHVDGYSAHLPLELTLDPFDPDRNPLGLRKHVGLDVDEPPRVLFRSGAARALLLNCIDTPPDTARKAEAHIEEVKKILDPYYEIDACNPLNSTGRRLLNALEHDSCGLIYILAHGELGNNDNVGRIHLSDRPIGLAQLPDQLPGSPFLLLNSCHAGEQRWSWDSGAIRSLALEFLKRGASGVVAPMCEVPVLQGLHAARDFFQIAVGATLGKALEYMRKCSHHRYYHQDLPDIAWFAYRLYGNPDRCLATLAWDSQGYLVQSTFTPQALRAWTHLQTAIHEAPRQATPFQWMGEIAQYISRRLHAETLPLPTERTLEAQKAKYLPLLQPQDSPAMNRPILEPPNEIDTTSLPSDSPAPGPLTPDSTSHLRADPLATQLFSPEPSPEIARRGDHLPSDDHPATADVPKEPSRLLRFKAVRGADSSLRTLLRDVANLAIERFRLAMALRLPAPWPLGVPELLDLGFSALQPRESVGDSYSGKERKIPKLKPNDPGSLLPGDVWQTDFESFYKIRAEAEHYIEQALAEIVVINMSMTSGAAVLLGIIEYEAHACLTVWELEAVILEAFLNHPLIGRTVMHGRQTEIARITERLIETHKFLGVQVDRKTIRKCLEDLTERARKIAGREAVSEQVLFLAFLDAREGWPKLGADAAGA